MPEATSESNIIPAEAPAFFRLGSVSNSKAKDVLHHIQTSGIENPRSTHQLLSLFGPEEFTDDPFHVLSSDQKPQTMWDQLARTASNEKNLTGDQKVAIVSIKRFALQSLAQDPVLNESVRDSAKTELQEYDVYLAKILDPEDPASARFFDRAKVAGKIAGKAVKASGTAYLVLNLMGCSSGGTIPTSEVPATPTNPAFTQTVPAIETPSPTEFVPTATLVAETPIPTLPPEFLAQFNGTEFAVSDGGLTYSAPGGEMINVPGQFSGSSFEFSVGGAAVSGEQSDMAVWNVAAENHLVVKGENGLPAYQFNPDTKVWETVEQVSMVDAFNNVVPGWVVEKSDVWEGELSNTSSVSRGLYDSESGTTSAALTNATLKQWELLEFINSDGIKMQRLNLTLIFKNDQGEVITVKVGMPELNLAAGIENLTPKQLLDSLVVGEQITYLSIIWIDTKSAMTPQKLAELSNQYAAEGDLCKLSVQACGLSIGRLGDQKHPTSWFDDVYHGLYGDNLDIAGETFSQGVK